MFDELDDPSPAPVSAAARAAVAARARGLRRRRAALTVGGTSLALALAGGAAARVLDPPGDRVTQDPAATRTATPTAYEWGGRDGTPGWHGGFSSCEVPAALPEPGGVLPYDFLVVTLELPESMPAAAPVEGAFVVRNDSAWTVRFLAGARALGRNAATGRLSADRHDDYGAGSRMVEVGPRETVRVPVRVETSMCGDGYEDDRPLPPGDYVMAAALGWSEVSTHVGPGTQQPPSGPAPAARYGTWYAPHTTVRLT